MPQLDIDSLVHINCIDPKVACESTLIGSQPDPTFPPESITISTANQIESWLENIPNVTPIYDRDDSTKGSTNPKSHYSNNNNNAETVHSKRFSGNLKATAKAPIIALPNKVKNHQGHVGHSARNSNLRIFPKKGVRVSEPGSPKVSCFGKVLSGREKDRRRDGCFRKFLGFFRRRREVEERNTPARERNIPVRERNFPAKEVEPPALGGMKRFVSGRRSASWGGDVEVDVHSMDGGHVAWSGPLD